VTSEIVRFDLNDPRNRRVASEIVDLLLFYKTGVGRPRDIVTKMRFVLETYCTFTYPSFFGSDDTLSSIVEKIRNAGKQHPACALLDELDDIHNFSWNHCRDDAPVSALDSLRILHTQSTKRQPGRDPVRYVGASVPREVEHYA
jgi:hypothetical protein